jgi:metal-sulfur cluster biosynthetic enzyme
MSPPVSNAASAAVLTEADIRSVLDTIVDPCSQAAGAPAGISEMGMIPEIRCRPDAGGDMDIRVRLIVTHPFCMVSGMFVREIVERLEARAGVGSVTVDFDAGTLWEPDMMSPAYAQRLAEARARRRERLASRAQTATIKRAATAQ